MASKDNGLDKEGFPVSEGVYVVIDYSGEEVEIDVYECSSKGLCCFAEEIPATVSFISGCDDDRDHIPVSDTTLQFVRRVRDLD